MVIEASLVGGKGFMKDGGVLVFGIGGGGNGHEFAALGELGGRENAR